MVRVDKYPYKLVVMEDKEGYIHTFFRHNRYTQKDMPK